MSTVRERRRRLYAALLGVALAATVLGFAVTDGLGAPDVGSGEVAAVEEAPDGTVTQEEFDAALAQTAKLQGIDQLPESDDPQFAQLRDATMSDLLLSRWVEGEAEERGVAVSDTEVSDELEKIKKQQFGGEEEFQKFLKQSGFSEQDALDRVRLQLLSDRIQDEVLGEEPGEVAEDRIEAYYEVNQEQFQQPESRDVRLILNEDEAKVADAAAELAADDSAESWERVASRLSTDQATKDSGGLRRNVTAGQSEPTLDEEIFAAPEGELVGPFEAESGFYLIQVVKVTPAETTPLDDVSEQISQQLSAADQQQLAADFQSDFVEKWTSRTFCADDYTIDRCANFEAPTDACVGDDDGEDLPKGQDDPLCEAPVPSTRPVAPGSAAVFGALTPGPAQGPLLPAAPPAAEGGTPIPLGPTGAPPTAPPTAPPPGG